MPTTIADETYAKFKRMIHKLVWDHRKKYGGSYDELLEIGHEAFAVAHMTWDYRIARFSTWLTIKVQHALQEKWRQDCRYRVRFSLASDLQIDFNDQFAPYGQFDYKAFLEGLSDDARHVVKSVFDAPLDVTLMLSNRPSPTNIRVAIRSYLHDIGWSSEQIRTSFREIREALK